MKNKKKIIAIVSPPYAINKTSVQSSKKEIERRIEKGIKGAVKTEDGKYKTGSGKFMDSYSENPQNIGNLKDSKIIGITSPPFEDMVNANSDVEQRIKRLQAIGNISAIKKIGTYTKEVMGKFQYGQSQGQIGILKSEGIEQSFDITQFHNCEEPLEWSGLYGSDIQFKKFITSESFAHPAKMSMLLADKIFKHLKKLGLLKKNDVICDFMAGTGRTNLMASLHGFDSIAIELEPHFIKMIEQNKEQFEKLTGRKADWQIIQGDSRKLSEIMTQKDLVGIMSPPYSESVQSSRHSDTSSEQRKNRLIKAGYDPKDYQFGHGRQNQIIWEYGKTKQNIGNLPDKQIWIKRSEELSNEMEEFAKNFKCEKCNEDYCEHMLRARGRKFKNRIDTELSNLIGITSPPFENSIQNQANVGYNKFMKFAELKHKRVYTNASFNKNKYGNNLENLGNQQGESYLQAMLQVYKEASKLMPIIVTITKNPTRKGKLRRLDLDTARLLMMAGYKIVDYHRAILFTEDKQKTLTGNIKKTVRGRLSFFKRLSMQKGNVVAQWEDILIGVRA